MNEELQKFARDELKASLAQLPENNLELFKRMYSKNQDLNREIGMVVDEMPAEKLDWAMQQVARTLSNKKVLEKS